MISKGNNVKFARFVLLAVSEEAILFFRSMYNKCIMKQLLDSVFVISEIIQHPRQTWDNFVVAAQSCISSTLEYIVMQMRKKAKLEIKIDSEQSVFSSKIRGEERKTSKRASVTASLTCERRVAMSRAAT